MTDVLAMKTPRPDEVAWWQQMHEQDLAFAASVVAERHGPWCGELEEWVALVERTRSDLETHLALKGAGLI